jgi:hypothetical protein
MGMLVFSTRQLELQANLVGDRFESPSIGADQHIGPSVERHSCQEQITDAPLRIGRLEQGPIGVAACPFPNGPVCGPEAHHQGVFFQAVQVGRIDRQAATGRNDQAVSGFKLLHNLPLEQAEPGLAFFGKDLGDGLASAFFNKRIGIDKIKAQPPGHEASHGGFACRHETDQSQIVKKPAGLHDSIMAKNTASRHRKDKRFHFVAPRIPNEEPFSAEWIEKIEFNGPFSPKLVFS